MSEEKSQQDQIKKLQSEIQELKDRLAKCEKEREEYLAGWQRQRADFLNYKKEEKERFLEFMKFANEGLILELLAILDNFERAKQTIPKDRENDQVIQGFLNIQAQLEDLLKKQGVEEIELKVGEKFDPSVAEVVEMVEDKEKEEETIAEILEKGYKLHGKLIRPAKVKVYKRSN